MVQINFAQKSVTVKIVYYGPGMSGKTTNLEIVHERAPDASRGDLTSISTDGDRTLFFDFMPLDLGTVAGMRTQFQIYTVPGQVYYNSTRKLVLQGVDGVIFVADSSASMMQENQESLRNLRENLAEYGKNLDEMPLVIQYNKRDLPDAMSIDALECELNPHGVPSFEGIANTGKGVFPTLKALAASVLDSVHQQAGGDPAPRPADDSQAGTGSQAAELQQPVRREVPAGPAAVEDAVAHGRSEGQVAPAPVAEQGSEPVAPGAAGPGYPTPVTPSSPPVAPALPGAVPEQVGDSYPPLPDTGFYRKPAALDQGHATAPEQAPTLHLQSEAPSVGSLPAPAGASGPEPHPGLAAPLGAGMGLYEPLPEPSQPATEYPSPGPGQVSPDPVETPADLMKTNVYAPPQLPMESPGSERPAEPAELGQLRMATDPEEFVRPEPQQVLSAVEAPRAVGVPEASVVTQPPQTRGAERAALSSTRIRPRPTALATPRADGRREVMITAGFVGGALLLGIVIGGLLFSVF